MCKSYREIYNVQSDNPVIVTSQLSDVSMLAYISKLTNHKVNSLP